MRHCALSLDCHSVRIGNTLRSSRKSNCVLVGGGRFKILQDFLEVLFESENCVIFYIFKKYR